MRRIFMQLIELANAKRAMYACGWHSPGRTLAEDIEALATAWSAAERKAAFIDHVEGAFMNIATCNHSGKPRYHTHNGVRYSVCRCWQAWYARDPEEAVKVLK